MAERFQKLFSLPPLLYTEGAPVLLAAGALQKDSQTGKVIGQLKFRSISPKQIRGLKAELQPLDMGGRPWASRCPTAIWICRSRRARTSARKSRSSCPMPKPAACRSG